LLNSRTSSRIFINNDLAIMTHTIFFKLRKYCQNTICKKL
jgi:hypothetical protein